MRDEDTAATAMHHSKNVKDVRITQGWNATLSLGKLFEDTLDIHQIAWEVYLVYKPA